MKQVTYGHFLEQSLGHLAKQGTCLSALPLLQFLRTIFCALYHVDSTLLHTSPRPTYWGLGAGWTSGASSAKMVVPRRALSFVLRSGRIQAGQMPMLVPA